MIKNGVLLLKKPIMASQCRLTSFRGLAIDGFDSRWDCFGYFSDSFMIGIAYGKNSEKYYWLEHVWVNKDSRKHGFGRTLRAAVEKHAISLGATEIRFATHSECIEFEKKNGCKLIVDDIDMMRYVNRGLHPMNKQLNSL